MRGYLLDTNIVSEPLRPRPDAGVLEGIRAAEGRMAIASVVWHELVYGVSRRPSSSRREKLERYLRGHVAVALEVLPYDTAAAAWHAVERARLTGLGRTPAFADGQIAAIAATRDLVLVTRNTADFASFAGLRVENWFTTA